VRASLIAVALLALGASCDKYGYPTDTPDPNGLGTALGEVCVNLRRYGCPEGLPTRAGGTCYEHLVKLDEFVHGSVPTRCLLNAGSAVEIRECGTTPPGRYTRFRCQP